MGLGCGKEFRGAVKRKGNGGRMVTGGGRNGINADCLVLGDETAAY